MKPRNYPSNHDDHVDTAIAACLNPANYRRFSVLAGAGSGKTRSLVLALNGFKEAHGAEFAFTGQKIAVITYTNAATEEIISRTGSDSLFAVSTIHSFCWEMLRHYHHDIQEWLLETQLPSSLAELRRAQGKSRPSEAFNRRAREIVAIERRVRELDGQPVRFKYDPNGDNTSVNSLSHDEVLSAAAKFLTQKPTFQRVLTSRFPVVFIDESQDTRKPLMEAFLHVAEVHQGAFALGLFGDTMQRIYFDGLPNLQAEIPECFEQLQKEVNHRSPTRIIEFGNALRSGVEDFQQAAPIGKCPGVLRVFVAPSNRIDKTKFEECVRDAMAEHANDPAWTEEGEVKTMLLVHRLAAERLGFWGMFVALNKAETFQTGLTDGTLPAARFFSHRVLPLRNAAKEGDVFTVMNLLRGFTSRPPEEVHGWIERSKAGMELLSELFGLGADITFQQVLDNIAESGLLDIPAVLAPFVTTPEDEDAAKVDNELGGTGLSGEHGVLELDDGSLPASERGKREEALLEFLALPFEQICAYQRYVEDETPFVTQHGVKGLEFDRVLAILDDASAKWHQFSYEKLFFSSSAVGVSGGAEDLERATRVTEAIASNSPVDATRRLLYVVATRAMKSLALVVYASDPEQFTRHVVRAGWFREGEMVELG